MMSPDALSVVQEGGQDGRHGLRSGEWPRKVAHLVWCFLLALLGTDLERIPFLWNWGCVLREGRFVGLLRFHQLQEAGPRGIPHLHLHSFLCDGRFSNEPAGVVG
ncbi:hypothetical protein BDV19DRAFT_200779 [Aspergillus venezuelensis]